MLDVRIDQSARRAGQAEGRQQADGHTDGEAVGRANGWMEGQTGVESWTSAVAEGAVCRCQ